VAGPGRFWSFLGRTGPTTAPSVEKIQLFKERDGEGEKISEKKGFQSEFVEKEKSFRGDSSSGRKKPVLYEKGW
jgi:hypothetical protein